MYVHCLAPKINIGTSCIKKDHFRSQADLKRTKEKQTKNNNMQWTKSAAIQFIIHEDSVWLGQTDRPRAMNENEMRIIGLAQLNQLVGSNIIILRIIFPSPESIDHAVSAVRVWFIWPRHWRQKIIVSFWHARLGLAYTVKTPSSVRIIFVSHS